MTTTTTTTTATNGNGNGRPKAYSYLRFSTPEQSKGDSFRRQVERAEVYAREHGLSLDDGLKLQDLGVSAFRGKNIATGALRTFLDAVDAEQVAPGSYLLIEHIDRLSRAHLFDALELFVSLINRGIVIVTLNDGQAYSREGNPYNVFVSLGGMIQANRESADKAWRIKEEWQSRRKAVALGKRAVLTGHAPTWLERDAGDNGNASQGRCSWQVREDCAAVIRRIFESYAAGMGQLAITKMLNSEGVPPCDRQGRPGAKQAARWHRQSIDALLHNDTVIGVLRPHTVEYTAPDKRRVRKPAGEPIEGYYPAIIDRDLWLKVQAMRGVKARVRIPQGQTLKNILGGLARCPKCGGPMVRINKSARDKLVCSKAHAGAGCVYKTVDMKTVEQALVDGVEQAVADAPYPGNGDLDERLERAERETAGAEVGRDNLIEAIARGHDSPALAERLRQYDADLERLQGEREAIGREMLAHDPLLHQRRQLALIDAFRGDPLDIQAANAALRQACRAVVVDWPTGVLRLCWQAGGESAIVYDWSKVFGVVEGRPRGRCKRRGTRRGRK